jgi:hypothetical protein
MATNEKVLSQPKRVQMECGTPSTRTRNTSNIQMKIGHEWIIVRNNACRPGTPLLPTYITEKKISKEISVSQRASERATQDSPVKELDLHPVRSDKPPVSSARTRS